MLATGRSRTLSLALSLALAPQLTACGGGDDDAADAGAFDSASDARRSDAAGADATAADALPDATPRRVVVNEVFAAGDALHPIYAADWVELGNLGATPVDVGGWHLTDTIDDLARGTFPAGTLVPPSGWLRVDLGAAPFEFSLRDDGTERLLLVGPDGADVLEDVQWPEDAAGTAETGVTWARIPDLTGPFTSTATGTPGAANVP